MKAQDQFPFDSAVVGLNGIYSTVGNDSYYINSPCIISTDRVITMYKTYILMHNPNGRKVIIADVIFLDAYCFEGVIYLIVQDIASQVTSTIELNIECPQNRFKWLLIDTDYFIDEMNANAVKQYCGGNCDTTKGNANSDDLASSQCHNDLLEFTF